MLVLVAKAIILGFLFYGAKQYYFEQPKLYNQNVDITAPVTPRLSHERINPRRTTTTTTEKPNIYSYEKPCGPSQFCVPYQYCNASLETEEVDGFNIDYSDTDTKCGYLNKCCDEANVMILKPNEKPCEPLIYKNCSFAADYALKHKHDNENSTQIETVSLPWIVNVVQRERYRETKDTFICAGSLIATDIVLTVASCYITALEMFGDLFVRAGEFGTNIRSVKTQERRVIRRLKHGGQLLALFSGDVLLLLLERPFKLSADLQPVCLPPKDITLDYDNCLIAGFPRGNYDAQQMHRVADYNLEKRQRFTLKLLPAEQYCRANLMKAFTHDRNDKLEASLICIDKEIDDKICHADAGSAIVCARRGSLDFYQVALARQNVRCGGFGTAGIETNAAHYRPWIEKRLAELNIVLP